MVRIQYVDRFQEMTIDRFIGDTLRESGDRLVTRQGQEIETKLQSRTGHLLSNRWYGVSGNRLTFTHPDYERFLDMRSDSRKRTRIHNRFTYGAYASIAERLLKGLEEKVDEVLSF